MDLLSTRNGNSTSRYNKNLKKSAPFLLLPYYDNKILKQKFLKNHYTGWKRLNITNPETLKIAILSLAMQITYYKYFY